MTEKGPWGSPEVERLDTQLNVLKSLRAAIQKEISDVTYEVEIGAHFRPEITFRELPDEPSFDELKKHIPELARHASDLLSTHHAGVLAVEIDEGHRSVRIVARNS